MKKLTANAVFQMECNIHDSMDSRFFKINDHERENYEDTEYDVLAYKAFVALQDLQRYIAKIEKQHDGIVSVLDE